MGKAGEQRHLHFIDGAAVYIGAQFADIPEDINIGQRLTGVKEQRVAPLKGGGELLILLFYFLGVINIKGCSEFFAKSDQVFRGE
jgi:hypothetical protein